MKDSHLIISQLKNHHAWSKLKEVDEISKLINSLTFEVRKYISFAHKKEQILLVALKNPNLCAEFNAYTAPTLLNLLHSLKEHFPLLYPIKQIKSYYPQKLKKPISGRYFTPPSHSCSHLYTHKIEYIQSYEERCTEGFAILSSDPKLKAIFQSIQTILQNHHTSPQS